MESASNRREKAAIIINIATIILEIIAFILRPNRYNCPPIGFYTVLSNYIALISSVLYLLSRYTKFSKCIAAVARYTAGMMLIVTFLVVVLVLVWFVEPVDILFYYNNGLHHLLIPIVTVVSYLFLEEHIQSRKEIIPTFAVSITYCTIMVVLNALDKVDGPYPFFMVQRFGLGTVCMCCFLIAAIMYPLCMLIYRLQSRINSHRE